MTTHEPPNLDGVVIPGRPADDRRGEHWPTHRGRDRRRRYLIRAEARDRRRANYDPANPRRR